MLPPAPGRRTPPGGEAEPTPRQEPGDEDNKKEDPGHPPPGRQAGRDEDSSPSSNGDRGSDGDKGNSSDGGDSNDKNRSEGSGSWRDSQNRDDDDDEEEEEPKRSGPGAGSMPPSQKGDASTEDQTAQAEEPLAKNTGKTGTPAIQPPAKGVSKRKAKKPHRKYLGFLPAQAQYTGPCLRKEIRYSDVDRKKPVLYLHPIHKEIAGKEGLQNVGYRTCRGNGHTRQEERDVW